MTFYTPALKSGLRYFWLIKRSDQHNGICKLSRSNKLFTVFTQVINEL